MGTCAPDMRCGAKPCPVKPVTATVEYFGQLQLIFDLYWGGSAGSGTRSRSRKLELVLDVDLDEEARALLRDVVDLDDTGWVEGR